MMRMRIGAPLPSAHYTPCSTAKNTHKTRELLCYKYSPRVQRSTPGALPGLTPTEPAAAQRSVGKRTSRRKCAYNQRPQHRFPACCSSESDEGSTAGEYSEERFRAAMFHSRVTFTALQSGSTKALDEMVQIGLRFYHAGYTVEELNKKVALLTLEGTSSALGSSASQGDVIRMQGDNSQWMSMVVFPMITAYAAGVPCAKTGSPWDPTVGDQQATNLLQYVRKNFVQTRTAETRLRLEQSLARQAAPKQPGQEAPAPAQQSPMATYVARTNRLVTHTLSCIYEEAAGEEAAGEGEGAAAAEAFRAAPEPEASPAACLQMCFLAGMGSAWAAAEFLERAVALLLQPGGPAPPAVFAPYTAQDFEFLDQMVPVGVDGTAPSQTFTHDLFQRWINIIYLTLMTLGMVERKSDEELEAESKEMASLRKFVKQTLELEMQQVYGEYFPKTTKTDTQETVETPTASSSQPSEEKTSEFDALLRENAALREQVAALEATVQALQQQLQARAPAGGEVVESQESNMGQAPGVSTAGSATPAMGEQLKGGWMKDPFVGEQSSAIAVMKQQADLVLATQAICSILPRPMYFQLD